jgi:hypothetical protein
MKKYLLLILLFYWGCAKAQQPFREYGYKVKIATLSKGKYVEAFDQDTIIQVGSVMINRLNGKIVSFVKYDTVYRESDLKPELISRWMSPDPLAEEFYNESPYNFVHNNPIKYVDPDGRAASPYYDQEGNFLGVDEKGFEGKIYVTNKETFDKNATNGVADSKGIQGDEKTQGLQDAGLNAEAMSNVYTDVLTKGGYDPSRLEGGAVAVNNGPDDKYNDPTNTGFMSTLPQGVGSPFKVTINQTNSETKEVLTTVENIQNSAGAHEYRGHGQKRFGIPTELNHYRAYDEQFKDPTWLKTTPEYRSNIYPKYKAVLKQNNPDLYKKIFMMERH